MENSKKQKATVGWEERKAAAAWRSASTRTHTHSLAALPLSHFPRRAIDFVSSSLPAYPTEPPEPSSKLLQLHSFGLDSPGRRRRRRRCCRRHRLWPFIERCNCKNYNKPRNADGIRPKPSPAWTDRRWEFPLIFWDFKGSLKT